MCAVVVLGSCWGPAKGHRGSSARDDLVLYLQSKLPYPRSVPCQL